MTCARCWLLRSVLGAKEDNVLVLRRLGGQGSCGFWDRLCQVSGLMRRATARASTRNAVRAVVDHSMDPR